VRRTLKPCHSGRGGIDFVDTANVYTLGGEQTTKGRTEEIVGNWLTAVAGSATRPCS